MNTPKLASDAEILKLKMRWIRESMVYMIAAKKSMEILMPRIGDHQMFKIRQHQVTLMVKTRLDGRISHVYVGRKGSRGKYEATSNLAHNYKNLPSQA